jgi:NAD-dependent dihydropyrimidine dehydrogenase PreA subunit
MTVEARVECGPARIVQVLRDFAEAGMCGRCLPCPIGVAQALAILGRLRRGEGQPEDLARLSRVAASLVETARCRRGKEAAHILAESLRDEDGYAVHLAGRCPDGTCPDLRRFRVVAERCTMCDRCREACPRGAIRGDPFVSYRSDNRPYVIVERKCDGCGQCVAVCPVGAVEPV